jgi:hypothetical protein
MYLYSTSVRPGAGNPLKVMDWAVRMTQKVNQIGEVPSTLWTTVMSPDTGTLAWTSVVSDLGIIETIEAKLAADSGYSALIDEAADLMSGAEPVTQLLTQLVHGDSDAADIDAQYASTVMATLAPGSMRAGIGLGVDIAKRVKQTTGLPTSFAVGVTGIYGSVIWVSLSETIQQLQAANEALNVDDEFSALLDEQAAKAYLPAAQQTISRRVV